VRLERYLNKMIMEDLKNKMVFVGGSRQVGKTSLSLDILSKPLGSRDEEYPEHRTRILPLQTFAKEVLSV
jgi:predicted AAA+ superfamily ATPase